MPYVPSEKTNPPAEDRKILDAAVEPVAQKAVAEITTNRSLIIVYENIFLQIARNVADLIAKTEIPNDPVSRLAKAIFEVGGKYRYEGAEVGEWNYAMTRFIQRVPGIMVERGKWKEELRYWVYAYTVEALIYAAAHTVDLRIGAGGVYEDVKDEYKWEMNRSYEVAQILKSGHCYFGPYYNRVVAIVDEDGKIVGHLEIMLKRSEETLHKDILDDVLVLRKKR